MRMKIDSLSSESSSGNQNSPEYSTQISVPQLRHSVDSNGDENETNISNTSQNSSSSSDDESSEPEESIENAEDVEEIAVQENEHEAVEEQDISLDYEEVLEVEDEETGTQIEISKSLPTALEVGNCLIEDDDYTVYTVITVNPNCELMCEEDDEEEGIETEVETANGTDIRAIEYPERESGEVISNVNISIGKNQHILEDVPEVSDDDDEYFNGGISLPVANFNDFLPKLPDEEIIKEHSNDLYIPVTQENSKQIEDSSNTVVPDPDQQIADQIVSNKNTNLSNEELEALPKIEDIKRYLLEDMPFSKLRHVQKSCSVPQSPIPHICMDIEEVKTSMTFEDLNLDLSDLGLDNDKDKLDNSVKMYHTLTEEDVNSFLITDKKDVQEEDNFRIEDMDLERPLEATISVSSPVSTLNRSSTPIQTVLDFCIEKATNRKELPTDSKGELEDFVDVESCNDSVMPVLEANNLNSLLEQFEASEDINTKKDKSEVVAVASKPSSNKTGLSNGTRLQDAGMQLNKNKMRQILMPPTPLNVSSRRSPSPVHSDHDYCSPKKRSSQPKLKGGQSLLKPDVVTNNRLLNSRHRSCKSKKIVYHVSSDEEDSSVKDKKKLKDEMDSKKKNNTKPTVQSNCRRKLSPPLSAPDSCKDIKKSVMNKDASEADSDISQNSNGRIKLLIKNQSKVILNCDHVDSQKDVEKCKNSDSEKTINLDKTEKHSKKLDRHKVKSLDNIETANIKEPRPKQDNFYTALFSNKQDVQIPKEIKLKPEKKPVDEELNKCMLVAAIKKQVEQPQKKKKLNLQEYKLRKGASSNNSSATVSPEAIFPDMPSPGQDKIPKCPVIKPTNGCSNNIPKPNEPEWFDPIKEASRKILLNTNKKKAEALRKRDEIIVMSKIPKVENLQLQPLISEAEMLKIVGKAQPEILPMPPQSDKPQQSGLYQEIVLVSVGINTDDKICQQEEPEVKAISPTDSKSLINFKIKKSDHVLKQNVFDNVKRGKSSTVEDNTDKKIDKKRYKDITATLKSVEKQVETRNLSNSLFSSIQDVVMKKAPEKIESVESTNTKSQNEKRFVKTTIVREYDPKAEHGEDKVILHLGKNRSKPSTCTISIQTDTQPEFTELPAVSTLKKKASPPPARQRNDSDMSVSSESSIPRKTSEPQVESRKTKEIVSKHKDSRVYKNDRSRSKDRYDSKYSRRRSRSTSRGRRRRSHSRSRSRSRSRGYRRYKRSDSPYKRKHRSRSPYKNRSQRSRSRQTDTRSKSPAAKKIKLTPPVNGNERKSIKSLTPPLRKPTISECSDSSTSSSSSSSSSSSTSSSSSSASSTKSRGSGSSYKRDEPYKSKGYRSYSSEDRESNTLVEERRIVFVGRLEKDITKMTLKNQFSKFGHVVEVRLHSKEDGSRYGFVTYQRARDAWAAVEASSSFPQYDVGFGGRRAFCRQSYADLDGLEAKYTESAFHGQVALPPMRNDDDMTFDKMLLEMKKKLSQRKSEHKRSDDSKP
ncbi:hypothetical protein HF086_017233 [Spodoptera exigua]|uniref:RRM domain-containing protein n=1 Tax=Spodoptera exigua TaxID=7107 RepID=A0A922ME41_SPOEX|nr:hypothetical protein HF086_017233 [Spodoptera exigua]